MKLSLLLLFFLPLCYAECPAILPPGVTCNSIGNQTLINLTQASTIQWDTFRILAAESMSFTGAYPVVNVSINRAEISGNVSAQGDFTLISEFGIHQSSGSLIQAPQVLLSTMSGNPLQSSTFTVPEEDGLLDLNGQVNATNGDVVLLGRQIELGKDAIISASESVQMLAMHQSNVVKSGSQFTAQNFSPNGSSSASVTNHGTINSHHVTIVSEGYITNSGKITTTGAGNSIHLAAQQIWHDGSSGGFISTSALTQNAASIVIVSPYIDPNDGQNPATPSVSVVFDDLAKDKPAVEVKANLQPSQHTSTTKTNIIVPSPHPNYNREAKLASRNSKANMKKKNDKSKVLFFGKVLEN